MSVWKKGFAALVCLALITSAVPCQAAVRWDWNQAYYSFLMDGLYKRSGQKYFVNPDNWEEPQFALYDMNRDGVPELLASNGCMYTADARGYVYTFYNGGVVYCGEIAEYLESNFYYEGNSQYPGLFFDGGGMGEFTLYYAKLEGTRLVWEKVADWNEPMWAMRPKDDNPDEYEEVYIEAGYTQKTKDNALFEMAETHLRKFALNENLPDDYSRVSEKFSIQAISSKGWDAFTAKYRPDGEGRSLARLPRVTFDPKATNQVTIYWETDGTHLYEMTAVNALTGEDIRSWPPTPGRYGEDSIRVTEDGVYEITIHTLDAATMETMDSITLYVSVTFAHPRTQEQMEQEIFRRSKQKLVAQMGTAGTEENALLNSLYSDYEKSFAHIYMGELNDNLEYQYWSAGYDILSDTVGFIIDGINDQINDPVEMELIQVLTDYLTGREAKTAEQFKHYADRASWCGDVTECLTGGDWNEMLESVNAGVDSLNADLHKIFPNIPWDLSKGFDKVPFSDTRIVKYLQGNPKFVEAGGKIISGAIAMIEYLDKSNKNSAVLSILMGNYAENIRILGELAERAQTEQMKNAIKRVARWMTNWLEEDLAQLYDETSEISKWVANLAIGLGVEALAEQAAGSAAKVLGDGLGGILMGQAIGSLLTKSAGDFIGANEKVAAANTAVRALKLETEYAVLNGDALAVTWLELFAKEMRTLNNATVLAVDAVHRGSFLRAVGDKIRDIKGRDLNEQDYSMIPEDSARFDSHRIQLMRCQEQHTLEAKQEVLWENELETGIVVYDQPEQAVIAGDWASLYASYDSADPEAAIDGLTEGSTVEILGELFSAKNGNLWYLICFEDHQCAFVTASSVQN